MRDLYLIRYDYLKFKMSEKSLYKVNKLAPIPSGGEVVISGISGRFPESDNMTELKENLFNKKDMVTDDDRRWKLGM